MCWASRSICPRSSSVLIVALCPHYTSAGSPVAICAVPRHQRVDLPGCDLDNDDEYDVDGLDPVPRGAGRTDIWRR